MRVTAEVQAATRQRILEVAQGLFASQGFAATTTRDIARAADIATGTMFNYFPCKEAVVASLAGEALNGAQKDFERNRREEMSIAEELFAFVAAGLRKLKPLRKFIPAALGPAIGPAPAAEEDESGRLRRSHLEAVAQVARRHGVLEFAVVPQQIYWSLYSGLLLFWANDSSPRQEDTLALLDDALDMFASWLVNRRADSSDKPKEG